MCTRLFRAAHANLARDGMHVHASATAAHVGPKRMFALILDFAAGSIRFDTPPRVGYANEARKGVHAHIAPSVRDRHTSRSGRYAYIIANIRCRHRPAGGGKLDVALDFFDADGPGSGLHFYRAAHAANRLRAGGYGGTDFRVARHLNRVSDSDVAHVRHILTDANGVASLFDGRIRESIVQALLRIVKAESRCAHFAANVNFAVV